MKSERSSGLLATLLLVAISASAIAASTPAHQSARHFMRGVNLGNDLDAPRDASWGARHTVEDLIHIKREGFDHIRLPVRWGDYAGPEPGYKLEREIFDRTDVIITNALNMELAVILDLHHFDAFTSDPQANSNKLVAIWDQIAGHYAAAPDALAFELLNEPRDAATTEVMNPIYATLIREIRKTSPRRPIFVGPGRWNQAGELKKLKLPEEEKNLIVTIHCYEPFYFTHQGATWSGPDTKVKGIQFPGPPTAPLAPDPSLQLNRWVTNWLHRYNTLAGTNNPCSPEAFRSQIQMARRWSVENNRPVHMGEFGCYVQADAKSRVNFYAGFRKALDEAGMGWAIWDWKAGFRYWDTISGQPVEGLREALLKRTTP